MIRVFISLVLLLSVTGCSLHAGPVAAGGALGGVAGAGTGAIIGAVIANGDIAASALLGGAVGIPVGLALGAVYDYYSDGSIRERKKDQIARTQQEIFSRQRQIDAAREKLRQDAPQGNPEKSLKEYQYLGPSLGNYYR